MRKTLLLTLALLLSTATFAQSRATILYESFDGTSLPSGWTIGDEGTENWSISATNKAGGEANELKLYWNPYFEGFSRVITTPIDLTGKEGVAFSLKHYFDNYSGEHTIGVATSTNGTTWNSTWEKTYSQSGLYEIKENVTTSEVGKDNVYFCIYYYGNSYELNNWYFDNFEIFTQEGLDLNLVSIDMPSVVNAGGLDIKFTVQNLGLETIESFTIETDVDDGSSQAGVSVTFETNLAPYETAQFSLGSVGTIFNVLPGIYNIPMEIVEVNGTSDDDATNNAMTTSINVAMGDTQKIPMIEHFSSSTCGPCVSVNYSMLQLTTNNPGKYTYTKYPCYWPGDGDPYYTNDAQARINFYSVGAAPQTFLDGADQGYTYISQESLDAQYNTPAFANVRGAYTIEGNTINVIADFMAYMDLTDVRAYISVNEKTTTGNVGNNGETEFHHILMKMLGNANGNTINLKAGEYERLEFTFDMSSTNVEEMNDLEVSLWLQDHASKEIYNSHFAYENTEHCYPVKNNTMTADGNNMRVTWEAPEAGNPTGYKVIVNGEVVEANTTDLSYTITNAGAICIAEVVALYGDKTSVGTLSSNFDDNEETPCNAPTNLNATVEQNVEGFEYNFKVTMSWDVVDGAEEYVIYLDGELLDSTTENLYVKGFDEEGQHYFTVASICENGESEQSEAFDFELIGTSVEEIENVFMIYPNPAKDFVKVTTDNSQQTTVRIYNCLGMLVEEISVGTRHATSVEINVSDYTSGLYFINVETENGNVVKKMIVE